MGAFEYTAVDSRGKQQKGVMEGDTAKRVRQQLRERDLLPLSVALRSRKKKPPDNARSRFDAASARRTWL